jgi:hypothetical protein
MQLPGVNRSNLERRCQQLWKRGSSQGGQGPGARSVPADKIRNLAGKDWLATSSKIAGTVPGCSARPW